MDDLPFIDSLQKLHAHQVGWMPTKQLEGKVRLGQVLIAESDEATERRSDEGEEVGMMNDKVTRSSDEATERRSDEGEEGKDEVGMMNDEVTRSSDEATERRRGARSLFVPSSLRRSVAPSLPPPPSLRRSVAYLIASDQYFKRDDLGIIYQLNVSPGRQRALVGAALLKAQFDRSAYGCRLYCCWCAQDIAANRFWEAMGFVPLAFRAGSEKKSRIHIFWQKRIRAGDEATPWWFPSKTNGGSIREDRIVLPIPPGTHWSDAKPMILPGVVGGQLSEKTAKSRAKAKTVELKRAPIPRNGLWFDIPQQGEKPPQTQAIVKRENEPKPKRAKADPKLVSAARELRDRWLERVNGEPGLLAGEAKYEVKRLDATAAPVAIAASAAKELPAPPKRIAA